MNQWDRENRTNIEGCEEESMFTGNHSMFEIILSRLKSVGHLVAKEETNCASAIHNEEDVARRRKVRSITDHVITSVLNLK